jgi:hypothetical protein
VARVNVDSECLSDTRFVRLARALGMADPDLARMKCVRVWHECTLRGRAELTRDDIDIATGIDGFAQAMVDADLARNRPNERIYVCGTSGRIEWFQSKKRAAKKGGEATRAAWKKAKESQQMTEGHVARPAGQAESKAGGRPSSSSSSSSSSSEERTTAAPLALKLSEPEGPTPGSLLKAAFLPWYRERYGAEYEWSAKEGKHAKDLATRAGEKGAAEVLRRAAIAAGQEWRKTPVTLGALVEGWNGLSVEVVTTKLSRDQQAELDRARRVVEGT